MSETNHPLGDLKLFEPKKGDMRIDYPELAEVPEFKDLSSSELKFVWYISNRTSPIISMDKADRWQSAAKLAFGENAISARKELRDIIEGKMPDNIKDAVRVMASYNPHIRLRAKFMAEYSFDQIQSLLYVPDEQLILMDGDMKKKYTDFVLNANKELPKLVSIIEQGYGVTLKNKKKEEQTYKTLKMSDLTDDLE